MLTVDPCKWRPGRLTAAGPQGLSQGRLAGGEPAGPVGRQGLELRHPGVGQQAAHPSVQTLLPFRLAARWSHRRAHVTIGTTREWKGYRTFPIHSHYAGCTPNLSILGCIFKAFQQLCVQIASDPGQESYVGYTSSVSISELWCLVCFLHVR